MIFQFRDFSLALVTSCFAIQNRTTRHIWIANSGDDDILWVILLTSRQDKSRRRRDVSAAMIRLLSIFKFSELIRRSWVWVGGAVSYDFALSLREIVFKSDNIVTLRCLVAGSTASPATAASRYYSFLPLERFSIYFLFNICLLDTTIAASATEFASDMKTRVYIKELQGVPIVRVCCDKFLMEKFI